MTPMQEWFARTTPGLIPSADDSLTQFPVRLAELWRHFPEPTGFAVAMARKQSTQRLLGMAHYFAEKEAAMRGEPYWRIFDWLETCRVRTGNMTIHRPSLQWPGERVKMVDVETQLLSDGDRQCLGVATRETVLGGEPTHEGAPLVLEATRDMVLGYFARMRTRRFYTRNRDQLTQVWEIDEFSNPLWLLTLVHLK